MNRYEAVFSHMRKVGGYQGIDKAITQHDVDVVVVPMDIPVCSLSTASGTSPFSKLMYGCFCWP